MSFCDGLAIQYACNKRACKRITRTHRISHLHLWRLLERRMVVREDVRAIGAARQDKHP